MLETMEASPRPKAPVPPTRPLSLVIVPILAWVLYMVLPEDPLGHTGRATSAMALWMAGWWVTECVPMAATALLPVAMFPLLGIASAREAAAPYGHNMIFLFLGGFMMAQAMERWNLHRRIALNTIRLLGTSPRRLVAGFMVSVAFLSMWISNTATVIMMVPTGISVVDLVLARLRDNPDLDPKEGENFAAALLLGIAYASSIGGIGTLIGTPPNALFTAFLKSQYDQTISFSAWMCLGVPLVVGYLPMAWWLLTRVAFPFELEELPGGETLIRKELEALGPMSQAEKWVQGIFVATALLWMLRPYLERTLFAGTTVMLDDGSTAILGALAMFLAPSGEPESDRVLSWEVANRAPWGILLLFGGGLSLAAAMAKSGVAGFIGAQFAGLSGWPQVALVGAIATTVVLLTEFTSNVATIAALLPVLVGVSRGVQVHPFALMLPAVFGASCAFMLPAATAPNAIVMGSGRVALRHMMRAGVLLNLVGILWITFLCSTLAGPALGVDLSVFPPWAL